TVGWILEPSSRTRAVDHDLARMIGARLTMCRVLLVEDDLALMRLLSWALLDAGHEVAEVRTAEDGGVLLIGGLAPDGIVFNTDLSPDAKRTFVELFRSAGDRPMIIELKERGAPVSEAAADAVLSKPFYAGDC